MAGVIRDPKEMCKFADDLENYVGNMKSLSSLLETDITDAKGQMRDDVSRKAFTEIENFREAIALEMPYCEELIEKLRNSAKHLTVAANVFDIQ